MLGMEHTDSESASDVMRWLQSEAAVLWAAFLGSLSLRRSRCVRPNCAACLSGEQYQSYVLYDRAEGRRIAVYVPEELVPQVQRGLDNGRALQDLLHQAAPRYIKALKRERAEAKEERRGLSSVEDGRATDQFCRLGTDASGSAPRAIVAGHLRFS
jgi:hypothetical protein